MIKPFIHKDFLLQNSFAEELYHDFAAKMPIIDYHNHLPPEEIAQNKIFNSITQVWIDGDHYKWRAMRTFGIDEKYITGTATDEEKFHKWAEVVPHTMRNPLFHWTHMELSHYFGIDQLLSKDNAQQVYEETTRKLSAEAYSCQNLLTKMNVKALCTTDDPIDDLKHHQNLVKSDFGTKVSTSFRPDKAIHIDNKGFNAYVDLLEEVVDFSIKSYDDLCQALSKRITYFETNGCKVSDHSLSQLYAEEYTASEVDLIFKKRREGHKIDAHESRKFKSAVLQFLAETYHFKKWVQQFHLGAMRNNNSRMLNSLGADSGGDSIGDLSQAYALSKFLDRLDSEDKLAKTIIYNLNPADNEVMASMIGNFNDGSVKGKIQWGSAWWFLDQKDGMTKQLNTLSNLGLISCFIGMLTDSRSFLSFPRHDYFRRILCNLFGEEIEKGELPKDVPWIGKMIQDISYNNAKEYFNF